MPSCWESYPLPPTTGPIPLHLSHAPLVFLPSSTAGPQPAVPVREGKPWASHGGCQSPLVCHLRRARGQLRAAQWPTVSNAAAAGLRFSTWDPDLVFSLGLLCLPLLGPSSVGQPRPQEVSPPRSPSFSLLHGLSCHGLQPWRIWFRHPRSALDSEPLEGGKGCILHCIFPPGWSRPFTDWLAACVNE